MTGEGVLAANVGIGHGMFGFDVAFVRGGFMIEDGVTEVGGRIG
jgi:hypothetical protein